MPKKGKKPRPKKHRPDLEVLARTLAAERISPVLDFWDMIRDESWDRFVTFRKVIVQREQEHLRKSHPDDWPVMYMDIGSEAGFLYGLELGRRLTGGAR